MEEDLYPLDGAAFLSEPEEQRQERLVEKGKALAAQPLLEEIIARFRDKIAFYDSVMSIPSSIQLQPEEFMRIVESNKLTMENLIAEVEWLESLIEESK